MASSLWHSHLMKIFEQLFVSLLRPQVQHNENTLQFADDTTLYLQQQAHLCLDNTSECLEWWLGVPVTSWTICQTEGHHLKD